MYYLAVDMYCTQRVKDGVVNRNRRVVKGSGEGDSGVWRVFGGQANQMTKLARAGGRWTDVQKDADSAECE